MAISDYMKQQVSAGFQGIVLIAEDTELSHAEVHATPDTDLSLASVFWIGSVTKPMTAMALLKLYEQGKFAFTDQLAQHLPHISPDKTEITIHQLLTHTAGLDDLYAAEGVVDIAEAVAAICKQPLSHVPGTTFSYSNDGYVLLAILIAQLSEESYEDYVQSTIFDSLDMSHSYFWGENPPRLAFTPPMPQEVAHFKAPNWGFRGATGLASTASDLFKFLQATQNNDLWVEDIRHLAFEPHFQRSANHAYGYGWQIFDLDGQTVVLHTGASDLTYHYACIQYFVESRRSLVMVGLGDEPVFMDTRRGLTKVLLNGLI